MAGLSPWRRKTTVEHVPSGTVPDTDMRTAVRALPCVLLPARKALDTCEALSSMAIVEMSRSAFVAGSDGDESFGVIRREPTGSSSLLLSLVWRARSSHSSDPQTSSVA